MSFAELADRYDDFHAPSFEVRVGNANNGFTSTEDFGEKGRVSGLRIETAIDRANRFSFSLNDVFDRTKGENGAFDPKVRSTFAEGSELEIRLGYGTAEPTSLLWGRVDSVKPDFPASGTPGLSVEGYDLRYGLRNLTGDGGWEDSDLETIVDDLVADIPFEGVEVDVGDVPIENRRHPETPNSEFLDTLAKEYDAEFFSRAGTFHFRKQSRVSELTPETTLRYGKALRSFTPGSANPRSESRDVRGSGPRVGTVKVRHNDEVGNEPIVGTAEVTGGGSETRVETIPVRSESEAEQRAQSIAGEIARTGHSTAGSVAGQDAGGRGGSRAETLGLPQIQIGRVLELTGLGDEFSGKYHVESANHRIDDSGYTTSFDLRKLNQ